MTLLGFILVYCITQTALVMIRELKIEDYDSVISLFESTPGVTVRDADSRASTESYLNRNPNLSFVKLEEGKIVGVVMSGHDGRRGYLQHLVVVPEFRKRGIGSALFNKCINALNSVGITKSHIFVFKNNDLANEYWRNSGWVLREELNMYSYNASTSTNA